MSVERLTIGSSTYTFDAGLSAQVAAHSWNIDSDGYARTLTQVNGRPKTIRMHQLVMQAPKGMVVDHKDRDKTNNTAANLRIVTLRDNNYNTKVRIDNKSGWRGVSAYGHQWRVQYKRDGRKVHGGYFPDILDAATAYNFYLHEVSNGFGQYNEVEQPWLSAAGKGE